MKTSEGAPVIYPIVDNSPLIGIEEYSDLRYFQRGGGGGKKSYKNTIKYYCIGLLLYSLIRYFR